MESQRLLSIDFFRGCAIVSMIIVNLGGAGFAMLSHSAWDGWTFADTIFPFFLWIMGVSMVFSFSRRMREGQDRKQLVLHIARRALIIFAIGILFNFFTSGFSFSTFRIMGVLQRIGLTYFFAGISLMYLKPRSQLALAAGLLAAYWINLAAYPMTPGQNMPALIDSIVLKGHMWTSTADPEGLLSTIPAIASVILGALSGYILTGIQPMRRKFYTIFATGVGLVILGYLFSIWLPFNKQLWTSSFAVLMAGLAAMLFSLTYWLIEIKYWRRWAVPFSLFGRNAIVLYIISLIFALAYYKFNLPHNLIIQLQAALTNVMVIYLLAYAMYRKRIFVKI
jgi:predicted acyltransferase